MSVQDESFNASEGERGDGAAEQLSSMYQDLPSEVLELKAIVGTMRIEASKHISTITALQEELDDVKASHSVVLQRSAEWQDELETLRLQVPQLTAELHREKQAREAETDRVKDLRIRAEESRRAIMRLQGEQSDARAKAKVDNRRSWVPATTTTPVRDEQEEAALKKSKRASLAFGPNALNLASIGRAAGHRRTNSASRSVGEDLDEPLSPGFQTGLRGLRLSGVGGSNGSTLMVPSGEDTGSAPNSRRSSFRSDSGRSPISAPTEIGQEAPPDMLLSSSVGSRLAVPVAAPRSTVTASPALSQSALSSVGVGSPILEEEEESTKVSPAATSAIGTSAQDRELKAREVEIERLMRELAALRTSRQEAIDARQASEDCLNALREFIASHDAQSWDDSEADTSGSKPSVGAGLLKGVKLPPLPTDDMDDATEAETNAKSNSVPPKGFATGWGVKLPNLMRKTTSSSTGTDENPPAISPSGETPTPINKTIANGFAGIGTYLTRTPSEAPVTATSPRPSPLDETGSAFKSFGWFKRASVNPGPGQQESAPPLPEKVMSPPFRSLDHDQLALLRSDRDGSPGTNTPTTATSFSIPSRQSSSSLDTAGSRAARLDELTASADSSAALVESLKLSQPEISYRAQKAAQKTTQVEHLTGVLPAFD